MWVWMLWLRGQDLNLRPSGYGPDELPTALPRDIELLSQNSFVPRGEQLHYITTFENCKRDLQKNPRPFISLGLAQQTGLEPATGWLPRTRFRGGPTSNYRTAANMVPLPGLEPGTS